MSGRIVVNYSSGHYVHGAERFTKSPYALCLYRGYWDVLPPGSPEHSVKMYAFKAAALRAAAAEGYDQILWADASIVPIAPLDPIWDQAERHGAWISDNGWSNYEWTSEAAYPALFPGREIEEAKLVNRGVRHVVATSFALDLRHPVGEAIFVEYTRLCMETDACVGPWMNPLHPNYADHPRDPRRCYPCGPADVRGHRHDQTVLSLVAWRAGVELTLPPAMVAYHPNHTKDTVLLVDGRY